MLTDNQIIEKYIISKASEAKIPISGNFELTPLCNLRCSMCYVRENRESLQCYGDVVPLKKWLELAKQMQNMGTLFLLLTGGEPLLYPDFEKLYVELRKLGMIITLNSNGTLIEPEIVNTFKSDKPRRINITIYGTSNDTYNKLCHNSRGFDLTIQGIERLRNAGIDVKLNGTLVPENVNEVQEMITLSKEYNIPLKIDSYIYPFSRNENKEFDKTSRLNPREAAIKSLEIKKSQLREEDFLKYCREYIEQVEIKKKVDFKCRAGISSCWITWNGNMTPCVFMNSPAMNVFENGFEKSWKYIISETEKMYMPLECRQCNKQAVCQVCKACVSCESQGSRIAPQYMCDYTKTLCREIQKTAISNKK